MKIIKYIIRYIIAIPLEIIRYPLLFSLKASLYFFGFVSILLVLFAYGYDKPELYIKAIQTSTTSALSGGGIIFYHFLLKIISPFYGWREKIAEDKYYDKEFRLDEYKNQRRYNETGFDKHVSEEDIYYMMREIYLKNK
jgi:hypothetical protein